MLGFIGIVAVIILGIKVFHLSSEIDSIKRRLGDSSHTVLTRDPLQDSVPVTVSTPLVSSDSTPSRQHVAPLTVAPSAPVQKNSSSPQYRYEENDDIFALFFDWFKENWLLKIGVLLILVGFGWFISYAFVHQWIGPAGRVILGFVTGTVLALYGTFRLEKHATQGKLFIILGSALILITSYAARVVYGYFTPVMSLAFVFLVSAYVSVVALQFKMKNLALYGLLCAYLTPLFIHSLIDVKLLFMYLIVVSLSSVWLTRVEGRKEINLAGLLGFALFAVPYIFKLNPLNSSDELFVVCSIFAMAVLYFIVSMIGALQNKKTDMEYDVLLAIGVSLLSIFTTLFLVDKEFQSLILLGGFFVFSGAGLAVFNHTKNTSFFYVYSLISVVLLGIVTVLELDGSVLVYAFAFEAVVISIIGYIMTRKLDVGYNLSMLLIIPGILSLESLISSNWSQGIFHDDFGVLSVMGLLLVGLGIFYYFSEQEAEKYNDTSSSKIYGVLAVVGTWYFLALIWLIPSALLKDEGMAVLISLITYTLIGISTYFIGLFQKVDLLKYYGGVLLFLVVARLLLIDVWDMALAQRIVTFISVGILFISTAFIGKGSKER